MWRNLVGRREAERELRDEVDSYVELLAAEKAAQGYGAAAARRAAIIEVGGVDQVKEQVRDARAGALLERVARDARYALRGLARSPWFAAAAVLALALGIAVTTSIFSLVYGVLLKPLPYEQPEELMRVWLHNPRQGIDRDVTSYPNFIAWRSRSRVFEHMVGVRGMAFHLTDHGEPQELEVQGVTEGYFEMYGVRPLHGGWFRPEQQDPDGPPAVILSYELWATRFGGDGSVIGRTINMSGLAYPVVGVMPKGFGNVDAWVPLNFQGGSAELRDAWGALWLPVLGRLRDGVTQQQAQAEMSRITTALASERPVMEGRGVLLESLQESMIGDSRKSLLLLLGSVVLVLLIACANIANLLLARGTTRRSELSVRVALGASRGALVRQVMVESVVLGLIGGVLGAGLAWVGVDLLVRFGAQSLPRIDSVSIDWAVLAFSFAASLLASVLFGAAPALAVARHQPGQLIRDDGRGTVRGAGGVRPVLVAAQFALAVVLLYGSGLLLRSFSNLLSVERGFDTTNLLAIDMSLPPQRYENGAAMSQFYSAMLERVRAVPGVQSADVVGSMLLSRLPNSAPITLEGIELSDADSDLPVAFDPITSGYLQTVRTPLLAGRTFTAADNSGRPDVAIVNETFVKRFLKGEQPIGRRFVLGGPAGENPEWIEIVGVMKDARRSGLDQPVMPYLFAPLEQLARRRVQVLIRTAGDPMAVVPAIRGAVRQIDPLQPLSNIRTMEQDLAETLAPRRFVMLLLAMFSAAAVVLAAIGIYGVISYTVGQRTREFGLRLALGARPAQVLRLVMRQAGRQVAVGLVLGTGAALAASRLLQSQLFEMSAIDVPTQLAVIAVLITVAGLAVLLPARKATGADPLIALRGE